MLDYIRAMLSLIFPYLFPSSDSRSFCVLHPMLPELYGSQIWLIERAIVPGPGWAQCSVLTKPFQGFILQPWVDSSLSYSAQYTEEIVYTAPGLTFVKLSILVLCPIKFKYLSLCRFSPSPSQLRESTRLCLGLCTCTMAWKFSRL